MCIRASVVGGYSLDPGNLNLNLKPWTRACVDPPGCGGSTEPRLRAPEVPPGPVSGPRSRLLPPPDPGPGSSSRPRIRAWAGAVSSTPLTLPPPLHV